MGILTQTLGFTESLELIREKRAKWNMRTSSTEKEQELM